MRVNILDVITQYNKKKHGDSDHSKSEIFVASNSQFVPLSFLKGKKAISSLADLGKQGFVHTTLEIFGDEQFKPWFENQYSKKLTASTSKNIGIYYAPNANEIFDAVEKISECYQTLKENFILLNGKKLPVQFGEWMTKVIFGLHQERSTAQRGFDFKLDGQQVEVFVSWGDRSNPKGVKLKKSAMNLCEKVVIMYLSDDLKIRDLCLLDSSYILRKFGGKGHTIFLKEKEIQQYLFSQSSKNFKVVVQPSFLLRYATPMLAANISEFF